MQFSTSMPRPVIFAATPSGIVKAAWRTNSVKAVSIDARTANSAHTLRSSRNSDAGWTPVTRRWSLARVQAT